MLLVFECETMGRLLFKTKPNSGYFWGLDSDTSSLGQMVISGNKSLRVMG